MWRSATCSSALLLAALVSNATAQSALTQAEALRLAFPAPAEIVRRTAYLDDAQLARAQQLAGSGVEVKQRVVTYYAGVRGGDITGVAYFDSHRVRTVGEVLMIVVEPAGGIRHIEVLKFAEPPEYKASPAWLDQFDGRKLDRLSLRKDLVNMTGATLTSVAVTNAARRVLALHAVIQPFEAGR